MQDTQGNKGGTAARLRYTPSPSSVPITFTFVNAHLAAFDEFVERRHADFHDISKRLNFFGGYAHDEPVTIYECDVLFWLVSSPVLVRPTMSGFVSHAPSMFFLHKPVQHIC
jgi:hypothetical protein